MDSSMPINDMLFEVFTKLDCSLVPPGFEGDARAMRAMQSTLSRVIDTIGEQSAAAQGLKRVITTTEKLRNSPTHLLYLLKDPTGLDGNGEVIGMLKVGRKHLFLFDGQDHVHEVEPICVLDFFVLPDKQRTGYGRLLFDFMLHDLEIDVHQMAIDGPSMKMERFLDRNFGVERLMRQNNNFAVSPQFFVKYPESLDKNIGRNELPHATYGRYGAPKPLSAIANVIHGGASYYEANQGMYPFAGVAGMDSPTQWKQFAMTAGDVSERELECDEGLPPVADERLPEPVPWPPSTDNTYKLEGQAFWDLDKGTAHVEPTPSVNESVASHERPKTLPVTTKVGASPAASFANLPAAGLPSTADTPASSCGPHRDNQHTEKGYFDVKFYHNPLW